MNPRATRLRTALVAAIVVILVAAPQAQQALQFAPVAGAAAAGAPATAANVTDIDLLVGRSTVVNVGSTIARVSLTVPDIADAMVTAPGQLLIHGKQPGTISLFVWDRGGAITTYEVKVRRDLSALVDQMKQLFPGEPIAVAGSGKDVVVSGTVSSRYVVEKAASVAAGYVDKPENVVNLLKQQEGVASNQVMLRVRFAEVSRSAMTELGASFFTGAGGFHDYVARSTTQQFSAPNFDEINRSSLQGAPDKWGGGRDTVDSTGGKQTFSDFLNLFVFSNKYNVGTVVKALQDKGLFQSLAEPNLIATNGKEASFLAGGEFPIPVVQSGGNGNAVTIMFKEFGIRLTFTPTVLGGDLINLKVRPEVSALDFGNAVSVGGFRIPALTTRRTDTEVELRDGQTFAIAGLLNNTVTDSMRKIPGIGDIPILGWLFKSRALQKNQTELVVMITPVIIKRGQMGASEGLPSLVEPYLGAPGKAYPNTAPYVGSPRFPSDQPTPQSAAPAKAKDSSRAEVPAVKPAAVAAAPVSRAIETAAPVALAPAPVKTPQTPTAAAKAPEAAKTPEAAKAPVKAAEVVKPSKQEEAAAEQAREQAKKAAAAAARQEAADHKAQAEQEAADRKVQAEQARIAERKAQDDQRAADKLAKEREAREADVARKNAETARRDAEAGQKRDKVLAEAAARLQAAQAAYQEEVKRAKSSDAAGSASASLPR
ncbi:MAG: pilus assembly protein N-terminal domain-containing protein [Acidobacteriota bacterium]